jgi:hypothetical protein
MMTLAKQLSADNQHFAFAELAVLCGSRLGVHDVPCPECSTWSGRSTRGRKRRVLRIWLNDPGFATFHCERCQASGFARDAGNSTRIDPQRIAAQKWEAAKREQHHEARQLEKARWMWRKAVPAPGTPAERYLTSRGISIPPPPTLRFLSPRRPGQHPAMIAGFGIPDDRRLASSRSPMIRYTACI